MRYAELLVAQHDRLGHNVRATLRRGLSERSLERQLHAFLKKPHPVNQPERFPRLLPRSLVDLYVWHNGGGELVPYFTFMPFGEALKSWDLTAEMAEDSLIYKNGNVVFANTSPFPILNFNNSDFIVMDVGARSPTRGSIGLLTPTGFSSVRNEFASLSQFFRAHYQCCKEGVYRVTKNGLDYDGLRKPLQRFRTKKVMTANGARIGW